MLSASVPAEAFGVFAQVDNTFRTTSVPWKAHPEVWFLVVSAIAIAWYATKILQPKAIAAGYEGITSKQKFFYVLGLVGVWLASDWPVHDVAETYLYSVHMLQHLLLSMLLPACFVLATPRWLLELVIDPKSRLWQWFRTASKPLIAGVTFNALTLILHWSRVVQVSADNGPFHFALHLMIFASGLLMWQPVVSPIREWRLGSIQQCIYLFSMSILPTVPSGWLLFAEGVVYPHYDIPARLFGIDIFTDQQAAGAIMKLFGGLVLWVIIVGIFARHAAVETKRDRNERIAATQARIAKSDLTYDDVTAAFDETPASDATPT